MPSNEERLPDWDKIAADADKGIPALIGKLQRLQAEGRLEMVMIGYAFRSDGTMVQAYTFEPDNHIWAVGLWEAVKIRLLGPEGFIQVPDDPEIGPSPEV